MIATMVAELRMSTLPATCTGAVRRSQMTTKGACEKVKGLVVMASDGGALLVCQRESQAVKDIHGPASVTTAIAPGGLAQIVEQAHNGNAVSGVTSCVRVRQLPSLPRGRLPSVHVFASSITITFHLTDQGALA